MRAISAKIVRINIKTVVFSENTIHSIKYELNSFRAIMTIIRIIYIAKILNISAFKIKNCTKFQWQFLKLKTCDKPNVRV